MYSEFFPDSVIFSQYPPDVQHYYGTFCGFLIGRVLFVFLTKNIIYE
jgi:hypothetical protein